MNETIQLLLNHVSVRKFKDQKLTKEQIDLLLKSAQAASSASHEQAYSIIEVTDPEIRKQLVEPCGGQEWTTQGHYFVFCGDFYRHQKLAKKYDTDIQDSLDSIDTLVKGVVDATLAAQNFIIAAESMGLGICVIGGVRDGIETVDKLLQLPDHVYPVFGLIVGYPDERNDSKPRLPQNAIYHQNTYETNKEEALKEYDEIIRAYYKKRNKDRTWSKSTTEAFSKYPRLYMKKYLQRKGWAKK